MINFNFNFLILTVPVALNSILAGRFNLKILFIQFLTLFVAEFARQWLWGKKAVETNLHSQKRFFFFGVVYNNSALERFFSPKSLESSQTQPKRIVLFALTYAISFFSLKYTAQFGSSNPIHLFAISTIISLWIFCKTHEQINRLLLLNVFINSLFFLNQSQVPFAYFFIWLVCSFFISFISQKLIPTQEDADKTNQNFYSSSDIKKSLIAGSVICILFVIFNTLVPAYNKDSEVDTEIPQETASKTNSPPQINLSLAAQKNKLMQKANISPETLSAMAKIKTQVGDLDLKQLPLDFKVKTQSTTQSGNPAQKQSSSAQQNPFSNKTSEDLQYFAQQLKSNKTLTSEDLKRLSELTKNLKQEEQQWLNQQKPQSVKEIEDAVNAELSRPQSSEHTSTGSEEEIYLRYDKAVRNLKAIKDFKKEIEKPGLPQITEETTTATAVTSTPTTNATATTTTMTDLPRPDTATTNSNFAPTNPVQPTSKGDSPKPTSANSEADLIQEYNETRNQIAQQVEQLNEKQKQLTQQKEEFKILKSIDKLHQNSLKLVILVIAFVVLVFVLSRKGLLNFSKKKNSANQVSLPAAVRRQLKDIYKALLNARLSPADEVLKSYYLVEMAMKEIDFPRTEDLPPQNYFEIVNTKFPFLGAPVKVATQLFNRVFYGEKKPSPQEITSLRASLKELMRKLQVV